MKEQEVIKRLNFHKEYVRLYSSRVVMISETDLETVLNMLKDLQKENKILMQTNKSYKGIINKKDTEIKEKDKEIENNKKKNEELSNQILKLYKEQDNYNARIEKKNEEIKKKDKLTKLLIDFIYKILILRPGITMYKLKEDGFDISQCGNCKDNSCRKCIKQYFERKSENGN